MYACAMCGCEIEESGYTLNHDAYFCSRECAETYIRMMYSDVPEEIDEIIEEVYRVTAEDFAEQKEGLEYERRLDDYRERIFLRRLEGEQ